MDNTPYCGKSKTTGKKVFGFLIQQDNENGETETFIYQNKGANQNDIIPIEEDSVGLFSGYKDKNGNKIYENDFVNTPLDKGDVAVGIIKRGNRIGAVSTNGFFVQWKNTQNDKFDTLSFRKDLGFWAPELEVVHD